MQESYGFVFLSICLAQTRGKVLDFKFEHNLPQRQPLACVNGDRKSKYQIDIASFGRLHASPPTDPPLAQQGPHPRH